MENEPVAQVEPVDPKERWIRVVDFPRRGHQVVGDVARVIREYVEPASEWSGKPEISMIVAVNPAWTEPLHLQPHEFVVVAQPIESDESRQVPNPLHEEGVAA